MRDRKIYKQYVPNYNDSIDSYLFNDLGELWWN